MSGADHAVRDLNENSRCVYPLGDKAIRVLHSNIGITGSEIECRFQGCKRRGRLQTSLVARTHFSRKLAKKYNFKPQNSLKCLKYPPQNEAESVPFRLRYGANGLMTCGSFTSQ